MRVFWLIIMSLVLIFVPGDYSAAGEIEPQQTAVLTVKADVPNGFDRDITISYQMVGDSDWNYEFVLNQTNGYQISQKLECGNYECIGREADDCTLSSEERFGLYSDYDLLVSVADERAASGVQVQTSQKIVLPETPTYGWVKFVVIGVVLVGVVAIFLMARK